MEAKAQDSKLWFHEVIQPKLNQLRAWAEEPSAFDEHQLKKFFKEFLSELELVQLDDYVVEHCVENIMDGVKTLNQEALRDEKLNLKELARIAWLKSSFDRKLFGSYWTTYRPFRKKNSEPADSSILNAYLLPRHLQNLVAYIEKAKDANPAVLSSVD